MADTVSPRAESKLEQRSFSLDEAEVREESDGLRFEGHAAVFDSPSEDLGGFTEFVERGAFRKVLGTQPDVRFLFNHNIDSVLARTKSGTMQLSEDPKGLHVDARWAPTSQARDLRILVERGDIDQMSFRFQVGKGNDSWSDQHGTATRSIHNFTALRDVSLVTFPAYPGTHATVRSLVLGVEVRDDSGTILEDHLQELAHDIHTGKSQASPEERTALDRLFAQSALVSPWEAERAIKVLSEHPDVIPGKTVTVAVDEARGQTPPPRFRLAARRRRLALIAPDELRMPVDPTAGPDVEGTSKRAVIEALNAGWEDIEKALAKVGMGSMADASTTPSRDDLAAAVSSVQQLVEKMEGTLGLALSDGRAAPSTASIADLTAALSKVAQIGQGSSPVLAQVARDPITEVKYATAIKAISGIVEQIEDALGPVGGPATAEPGKP